MSNVDENNIVDVKRRARAAQAVQFTGKNNTEVIAFVRDVAGESARNGGSYLTVTTDTHSSRARKGDWVVLDADGTVLVLDQERFDLLFALKGR